MGGGDDAFAGAFECGVVAFCGEEGLLGTGGVGVCYIGGFFCV